MNTRWILPAVSLVAWIFLPHGLLADDLSGAKVYSDNCARCHQPRAPYEYKDADWEVIIHHMHVRGYLTEPERTAVLHYLQSANKRAAYIPPSAPSKGAGATTDGKELVANFGCQGCHVIGGEGGTIGLNLDTLFQRRDEAYVLQKLSDPTFDNPLSVMPYFGLNDAQKKALVEYLRSMQQ